MIGQFALAATLVSQGEEFDHGAAGLPLRQPLHEHVEGSSIGLARKEPVAIDEVQKRHRLATQRMNDMAIIDDLVVRAGWRGASPPQRHELRATDEDVQPVVEELYPEAVTDEARRHGVEHLAQREAAG